MYFDLLFRGGCVALGLSICLTHSWMWGLWLLLMSAFLLIQRTVSRTFTAELAVMVFVTVVSAQAVLTSTAAFVTGLAGAWLLAFGCASNTAVIMANEGRMPIIGGWSDNPCYREADEHTRLVWLCDIFPTTETKWANWLVSAGDALEVTGLWVLAAQLALR